MYKFKIGINTLDIEQRKEEIQRLENELEPICSSIKIIPYSNALTVNVTPNSHDDKAKFLNDLRMIIQAYPDYSEIERVD